MRLAGVGKRYGRGGPWVVRGVELTVRPGALVRIEGANGCGKSTLLKLLAGIERPAEGRVEVTGSRAWVPERFPAALPFDVLGYLRQHGRVRGLSAAETDRRSRAWLERFGIAERAGTPIGRLSKGTAQKVAVAQALLAEPEVLLLDEAWTGLDQAARGELDEAVAERAAAGGVVFFVDHDPGRLAGLVDAAYAVADGRLRAAALPDADRHGPRTVVVVEAAELPQWLPGGPERKPLADGAIRLDVAAAHSDALLRRLLAVPAVHVRSVRAEEGS
ncbi:ABC transporter ATP-binding protein [Kitasatospora sp. NPDC049285]|uniref:ABC transporter ATP-binding protein n=1 Tax=Kitasatospora sp. NPDC049285 TaxID=3157096 RepID=UPI00343FF6EB